MNTLTTKVYNPKTLQKDLSRYQEFRRSMFHPKSDYFLGGRKLLELHKNHLDERNISDIFSKLLLQKAFSIKKINIKSTFHILYTVETKAKKYVLKINILDKYKDFSFVLESFIQYLLHMKNMSFINILFFDNSRLTYPFDFMIMEYMEANNIEKYKDNDIQKVYMELGKYFQMTHNIESKKAGTIDYSTLVMKNELDGSFSSWEDFFPFHLQEHIEKCFTIGVIDKKEKQYIKNVCTYFPKAHSIPRFSLLHNDAGMRNIKATKGKIAALFDWEDAIFGDPLWDIAFIDTFHFKKEDEKNFSIFCKGYKIEQQAMYKNALYWLYYLRISLVKTISRYSSGQYNTIGMEIDRKRVGRALKKLRHLI